MTMQVSYGVKNSEKIICDFSVWVEAGSPEEAAEIVKNSLGNVNAHIAQYQDGPALIPWNMMPGDEFCVIEVRWYKGRTEGWHTYKPEPK